MLHRSTDLSVAAAALTAAALAVAGCGWSEAEPEKPDAPTPRKGGTLRVAGVRADRVPDPHRVTTREAAMVHQAVHRTLYTYRPDGDEPVADLAEGRPSVSKDGRRVTVRLADGARFAPSGEPVTAADVEHGLERALADPVAGPSARRLLGAVAGLPAATGVWRDVPGIEATGRHTLVLRLRRPEARLIAAALATPASTPIPAEVPRRLGPLPRAGVAYTGPYLPAGTGVLAPGTVLLERNATWNGGGPRPAYVERIHLEAGDEPGAAAAVLDGEHALWAGSETPRTVVRRAARRDTRQLVRVPLPVTRYVALNAAREPFGDPAVRRAAVAAIDRRALWRAAGGTGEPASHWLPPGVVGHDRSGGAEGLAYPFLAPDGDLALAREQLREAGFEDGRYDGPALPAVAGDGRRERAVAREVRDQLERVGFRLRLRFVPRAVMAAVCRAPASRVAVCPGAALGSVAGDPEALLRAGFAEPPGAPGAENWSHLDAPAVDLAVSAALHARRGAQQEETWAAVNRAVAFQAPGAPWRWDERPLLRSQDARGVVDERLGTWALAWSWLEERR